MCRPRRRRRGRRCSDTLEQIELVKAMIERYPDVFEQARTAADVERIAKSGKIASLIGVEGGHSIEDSLENLRRLHALGAGYMTLTHSDTLAWADSATDKASSQGLDAVRRGSRPRDEPPGHARRSVARLRRDDEGRPAHQQGADHLFAQLGPGDRRASPQRARRRAEARQGKTAAW